jgi:sec-independent protein translocase protein TatC
LAEPQEGPDGGQMSLIEHLVELRRRILICAAAVAVTSTIMFFLFPQVLSFLEEPYREVTKSARFPDGQDLIAIDPLQPFLVRLKVSIYGGVALALPIILWEIWRFVVPALHPKERRYALPFILSSIVLFLMGVLVAWFTITKALDFLLVTVTGGEIQPAITADKYLTLVMLMFLAFGASFLFPVLLVFLLLVGVINTAALRRSRRWAIVGITIFAAVITPSQDPISLLFMAVPMYVFYEAAIVIGRVMKR